MLKTSPNAQVTLKRVMLMFIDIIIPPCIDSLLSVKFAYCNILCFPWPQMAVSDYSKFQPTIDSIKFCRVTAGCPDISVKLFFFILSLTFCVILCVSLKLSCMVAVILLRLYRIITVFFCDESILLPNFDFFCGKNCS